jgi:hypothetical protein
MVLELATVAPGEIEQLLGDGEQLKRQLVSLGVGRRGRR